MQTWDPDVGQRGWFKKYPGLLSSKDSRCASGGYHYEGHAACFPKAVVEWDPDRWSTDAANSEEVRFVPTLPRIQQETLRHSCKGVPIRVARASWVEVLRTPKIWLKQYAPFKNTSVILERTALVQRQARCEAALAAYRPRVCTLRNVLVWGKDKRMFRPSQSTDADGTYFMPQAAVDEQRVYDEWCPGSCRGRTLSVPACGGHAVIGRNSMGVNYFHTMYETFGSTAFLIELLQARANASGTDAVRLLDNVCIPPGTQPVWRPRSRSCSHGDFGDGPKGYVRSFLSLLGLELQQLQHFPYATKHREGPSVHLDRATFDCSQGRHRNFWHVHKLREVVLARLAALPWLADVVLLIDRGKEKIRAVAQQKQIHEALKQRFSLRPPRLEVLTFLGNEPLLEQARAFGRARLVIGPHGAGLSNILFCRQNSSIIEYLSARPSGQLLTSALYANLAQILDLDYWVIPAFADRGKFDDIGPEQVLETAELALGPELHADVELVNSGHMIRGLEENHFVKGYDAFHRGWPTGW